VSAGDPKRVIARAASPSIPAAVISRKHPLRRERRGKWHRAWKSGVLRLSNRPPTALSVGDVRCLVEGLFASGRNAHIAGNRALPGASRARRTIDPSAPSREGHGTSCRKGAGGLWAYSGYAASACWEVRYGSTCPAVQAERREYCAASGRSALTVSGLDDSVPIAVVRRVYPLNIIGLPLVHSYDRIYLSLMCIGSIPVFDLGSVSCSAAVALASREGALSIFFLWIPANHLGVFRS